MNVFGRCIRFALPIFLIVCCLPQIVCAQAAYDSARSLLDKKEYAAALPLYRNLYERSPDDDRIAEEYLVILVAQKDMKTAEKVALKQLNAHPGDAVAMVEAGNIFMLEQRQKKAEELFQQAITHINGDNTLTQQIAGAFARAERDDWAIKAYERAVQVTQSPGLYSAPLARLYAKSGQIEKALQAVLDGDEGMPGMPGDESLESKLLELIGNDASRQKVAQKEIIKRVNANPENYRYAQLLVWIFSVQDNWNGALLQVQALERRNADKGRMLMDFADAAARKDRPDVAAKAYDAVIAYGPQNPFNQIARQQQLHLRLRAIIESEQRDAAAEAALAKDFDDFLANFPAGYRGQPVQDAAMLHARYLNNADKAIELLQRAVQQPGVDKFFAAACKLQLGDYYVINGDMWEAALLYAQVDKAFKQDATGEEARFRRAKLAYYQNDFQEAQAMLGVLKAVTSELIANDALYLSVLITENIPADSNVVPLQRFAAADLLLFQNKYEPAKALLDSIVRAFPETPLNDDILLLQSEIAQKQKQFPEAEKYLQRIVEKYGKDVLADDALMRLALLNAQTLHKPEQAKKYYEQLIVDYPGSSFVPAARKALQEAAPAAAP